jgi:hypothetical protein
MASKMPAALDENNECITIGMAERGQCWRSLKCEFCDALVGFVNGHNRTVGEVIVAVEPFFRLERGHKHSKGCQYNVHGQITIIVSKSNSDIFVTLPGDRYELRLLTVKKGIEQLRELSQKKKNSSSEVVSGTTEKIFFEREEQLGAYINSARRVLKVRAACEKHSEIEEVLDLVFDGNRLPWRDFYFEDKNYFRCFRQVTNSTVKVPVAIRGTVKATQVVPGRNDKFAVINLVPPYRKTKQAEVLDAACFSIWSPDLSAFESYEPGGEILAFGLWESRGVSESPNRKNNSPIKVFRNHELCLWPVTKSQIEYHRVSRRTKPSPKMELRNETHNQRD